MILIKDLTLWKTEMVKYVTIQLKAYEPKLGRGIKKRWGQGLMLIQSTDEYLDFEESRDIQECSMGLKFNRNKLSLQSSYMRGNKFSNPQRT